MWSQRRERRVSGVDRARDHHEGQSFDLGDPAARVVVAVLAVPGCPVPLGCLRTGNGRASVLDPFGLGGLVDP